MMRYCHLEPSNTFIEQTSTDAGDIGVHDAVIVVRIEQHVRQASEHPVDLHELGPFRLDYLVQRQWRLLGSFFGVCYGLPLQILGWLRWLFVVVFWVTHCSVENTRICCVSRKTLSRVDCEDNPLSCDFGILRYAVKDFSRREEQEGMKGGR